jgi:hypothetical protein
MSKIQLAAFSDRSHAEDAIGELERAGFDPKEISVVIKDDEEGQMIAKNTGARVVEGTMSGATTGGVLGGLAGLLVGIGAITIPGVGALFIAGPLAASLGLTGAAAATVSGAATGALAGGLVGALVGLGVPQATAEMFEREVKAGGVIVAVPSRDGQEDRTKDILEAHGATQIEAINVKTPSFA